MVSQKSTKIRPSARQALALSASSMVYNNPQRLMQRQWDMSLWNLAGKTAHNLGPYLLGVELKWTKLIYNLYSHSCRGYIQLMVVIVIIIPMNNLKCILHWLDVNLEWFHTLNPAFPTGLHTEMSWWLWVFICSFWWPIVIYQSLYLHIFPGNIYII